MSSLELAESLDPSRRRVIQGALGMALGFAMPGGDSLHGAPRPLEERIHINQVGYLPTDSKRAVVAATDSIQGAAFLVVDDANPDNVRHRGALKPYEMSGGRQYGHYPRHYIAEFGRLSRPGRYRVRLANGKQSAPFNIGADLYRGLVPLSLNFFGLQQCGDQMHPARSRCHLDDGIVVGGLRNGQPFDASGGWHDAGDFLKFVETTSYATALLLFGYERMGESRHIGALADARAELLEQARVGLKWLLKIHPSPGEFYYQVGDESDHNTWRLPEQDAEDSDVPWEPRAVLFGVGANLAGRCAAAFAMGSRHLRTLDPALAARCRKAAESVFALGLENRSVLNTRPASFYPEETWEDDMEWGAVELYRATGGRNYLDRALDFAQAAGSANAETSVYNTHAMAHYTLVRFGPIAAKDEITGYLQDDAYLIRRRAQNPYQLGTPYVWGTAEAAVGSALTCLLYAELSREHEFTELARRQRDFVLGCNPFGISCVIGAGTRFPRYPHHQIANLANIPLNGAVVGGPTSAAVFKQQSITLNAPDFANMVVGPAPPEIPDDEVGVYYDAVQDYVTNEPANDYTAKFIALSAFYC